MKGNSIEANACEGQFHQSKGLQQAISSKQPLTTTKFHYRKKELALIRDVEI